MTKERPYLCKEENNICRKMFIFSNSYYQLTLFFLSSSFKGFVKWACTICENYHAVRLEVRFLKELKRCNQHVSLVVLAGYWSYICKQMDMKTAKTSLLYCIKKTQFPVSFGQSYCRGTLRAACVPRDTACRPLNGTKSRTQRNTIINFRTV